MKALSAGAVLACRPRLVSCSVVVNEIETAIVIGGIAPCGIVVEILLALHKCKGFQKSRILSGAACRLERRQCADRGGQIGFHRPRQRSPPRVSWRPYRGIPPPRP